jgi:hypothetical protein
VSERGPTLYRSDYRVIIVNQSPSKKKKKMLNKKRIEGCEGMGAHGENDTEIREGSGRVRA